MCQYGFVMDRAAGYETQTGILTPAYPTVEMDVVSPRICDVGRMLHTAPVRAEIIPRSRRVSAAGQRARHGRQPGVCGPSMVRVMDSIGRLWPQR